MLAVTEMLLQSWDGILRLFPLWPGEDASFRALRAVGAFLVTASLSNHTVHDVVIHSEVGELCHLQSPWATAALSVYEITSGTAVTVSKSTGSVFAFATKAGASYSVVPASDLQ